MKALSVILVIVSTTLAGCAALAGKPTPPPPPTQRAQEINRGQASALTQFARVTVNERGSPMDAERAIGDRANARQARYYQIIMLGETISPGVWRAEAILYR